MKVIVAGGGVGGLFLAKALQKKGIEVTILEKTGKFARFGGPIQVIVLPVVGIARERDFEGCKENRIILR